MRGTNKLTAARVDRLKKPGRYGDGGGLWLQIAAGGTKSWLLRYQRDGKARQMGLGPCSLVSLADARERARDARRVLLDGGDPIDARNALRLAAKIEAAKGITFQQCAEKHIAAHEAAWRNEKHRAQWHSTLERYAYPKIGSLPVSAIDTTLILKVLEPIWGKRPETAGRLRGRIEAVLDWATAREYRAGDNPARWRGHLDKLLPAKRKLRGVQHHTAMPYEALPVLMGRLRRLEFVSARALEFTILTAARTGETIGARWAEIDIAAKIWTVPEDRTKSGREHRVPLSDRAVELLEALPRQDGNDHVFVGGRKGAGLSNMAMLELVKSGGVTVHGFRSTFRDWAAETTAYPNHVVEMALAHVIGDKVEAAYRRGDLFEKRRRLMRDWATYCAKTPKAIAKANDNVVAMRASA
jgi:integrase